MLHALKQRQRGRQNPQRQEQKHSILKDPGGGESPWDWVPHTHCPLGVGRAAQTKGEMIKVGFPPWCPQRAEEPWGKMQ